MIKAIGVVGFAVLGVMLPFPSEPHALGFAVTGGLVWCLIDDMIDAGRLPA